MKKFSLMLLAIMATMFVVSCEGESGGGAGDACDNIISCVGKIDWWSASQRDACLLEMAEIKECQVKCIAATSDCATLQSCTQTGSALNKEYCDDSSTTTDGDVDSTDNTENTEVNDGGNLENCTKMLCKTEYDKCMANTSCVALGNCSAACTANDNACYSACSTNNPDGVADGTALETCMQAKCSKYL